MDRLIDEDAFEAVWEEFKLPILTNKLSFRRHIEAYEAAKQQYKHPVITVAEWNKAAQSFQDVVDPTQNSDNGNT